MSTRPTPEERAAATRAWLERYVTGGAEAVVLQDGYVTDAEDVDLSQPFQMIPRKDAPGGTLDPEEWVDVGFTNPDEPVAFTRAEDAPHGSDGVWAWYHSGPGGDYLVSVPQHVARQNGKRALLDHILAVDGGYPGGTGPLRAAFDGVREWWHGYVNAASALVDAGILDDPGPTDPRARALWLHQRRNTGPAKEPPGARRKRR